MNKGRKNEKTACCSPAFRKPIRFATAVLVCLVAYSALVGCAEERLRWEEIDREIDAEFPHSQSISVEELKSRLDSGKDVILVDVRDPAEFEISRIEGAVNLQTARAIRREFSDSEKPVVLYCSVGYRSGEQAARLHRQGMEDVYNLRGSIFKWAEAGLPLVNDQGETVYVHPYDEYWGQLLERRRHRYGTEGD